MTHGHRTQGEDHSLERLLETFVAAVTWNESRRLVETEPALLEPAAATRLETLGAEARAAGKATLADSYEEHARLLRRAATLGIAGAFAEIPAARRFPITPELQSMLDGAWSATQSLDRANTPENFEAAVSAWTAVTEYPGVRTAPLAISQSVNGGIATVLLRRFQAEGDPDDLNTAIDLFRELAEMAPAADDMSKAFTHDLAVALVLRYERMGRAEDLDEAIGLLSAAVADDAEDIGGKVSLGTALTVRYKRDGDLETLDAAVGLLAAVAEATPSDSPVRASRLVNLANAISARSVHTRRPEDLDLVVETYQAAVASVRDDSATTATLLANQGDALLSRHSRLGERGDLDSGLDSLRRAVDRTPPGSPDRPRRLALLGAGLLKKYEVTRNVANLDEAVDVADQAVSTVSLASVDRAYVLAGLAGALRTRSDRSGDAADIARGVEAYRAACFQALRADLGRCLNVSLAWGEWAAERDAWSEAAEAYGLGLDVLNRLVTAQSRRQAKESWLEQAGRLPSLLAYATAKAGNLKAAVLGFEHSRALLLSEGLQEVDAYLGRLVDAGEGAVAEAYRQAADRVALTVRERALASAGAESHQTLTQIRDAQAALASAVADVRHVPGFEDFLARLSWEQVLAASRPAPLVYVACGSQGGVALIVDPSERIRVVWLPDLSVWSLLPESLHALGLFRGDLDPRTQSDWWGELTSWMWTAIMGPLFEALPDEHQLTLIPGGSLALLPLHAAARPDATAATGYRYAIDDKVLSYSPNARASLASFDRARASVANSLLCIVNPGPSSYGLLAHADREIEGIRTTFPTTRVVRGRDATRDNVQAALGGFDVLHFACHAVAESAEPMASGLILAADRRLTLEDLIASELEAVRLIVLSACETAVAGDAIPDEVISLPVGLLHAGAAGVIASQWPVFDVSTMLLMTRFYELWRSEHATPAVALREAQRWLRDATAAELHARFPSVEELLPGTSSDLERARWMGTRPAAHPESWAAFVCIGW